jgi:hypothetical protein
VFVFRRLKINQDSHEFILESGTVTNNYYLLFCEQGFIVIIPYPAFRLSLLLLLILHVECHCYRTLSCIQLDRKISSCCLRGRSTDVSPYLTYVHGLLYFCPSCKRGDLHIVASQTTGFCYISFSSIQVALVRQGFSYFFFPSIVHFKVL